MATKRPAPKKLSTKKLAKKIAPRLERWEELGNPRIDQLLRDRTVELLNTLEPPEDHDEIIARGEAFLSAG